MAVPRAVNFIFWALNFVEQAKFDTSWNLDKPCQREEIFAPLLGKTKFKDIKEPNHGFWQQYFVIDLNVALFKICTD